MINQLLSISILITKTGGITSESNAEGGTKYPVKCVFENIQKFRIKTAKHEQLTNITKISEKYEIENENEVKDKLSLLNNSKHNEYDYIVIEIPEKFLNVKNQFLKRVSLIDMIGVPDPTLKKLAHERNLIAIRNENLDVVFLVKRDGNDRGFVNAENLINLNDSDIFKRTFKTNFIFPPKLVSVWAFNMDKINEINSDTTRDLNVNFYNSEKQQYQNHLHLSLLRISKKKTSQENENKLLELKEKVEFKKFSKKKIYADFENTEHKEIESRLSALLYFPETHPLGKSTTEELNALFDEVYLFKKKKQNEKLLSELNKINTETVCKLYSKSSKVNDQMFKFTRIYRATIKKDSSNILKIETEFEIFFKEINQLRLDLDNKRKKRKVKNDDNNIYDNECSILALNIFQDLKNRFIDRIIKIFTDNISHIRKFFEEKINQKENYNINEFLDYNFYRQFLVREFDALDQSNLERPILNFKKKNLQALKSKTLDKYKSIKDEIYCENKTNDRNKKALQILIENDNQIKLIKKQYQTGDFLEDVFDTTNEPVLLRGKQSTTSVNSSNLFELIKNGPHNVSHTILHLNTHDFFLLTFTIISLKSL